MEDHPTVLAFDLETTGTDPAEDRIVELAYQRVNLPVVGRPVVSVERFNPGRPIPGEATAVHGIADEDVAELPQFRRRAPAVQRLVDGADYLMTYNGRSFDVPLLHAELRRAGQSGVDLEEQREVDLYRVWQALEPRTLAGAVARFAFHEDHQAHDAGSDVDVLLPVLWGMIDQHESELRDGSDTYLTRLAEISVPDHEVDRSGKLIRRDGEVCFAFGKHRGEPVREHPEYAEWLLGADFPADTKKAVRNELNQETAHA